jgi:hypothetical protein
MALSANSGITRSAGKHSRERAALADRAVDPQSGLMPLQHMFDDGESESGAAGGA